ncbi:MAG: hypothetical protein H0W42_05355 [Gemmatimonadaceae bacterium]|nr:hypothetical protein [Gemmatimonadaceae bacterium]
MERGTPSSRRTPRRGRFAVSLLCIAVLACNDKPATAPQLHVAAERSASSSELLRALPGDSAAADSLGRSLALALSDASVRQQILADLRDSPFPRHKIHLPSYLRGSRGVLLVGKMAQAGGIASARVMQMADIRGGLQLAMVRPVDRIFWTGTPDIAVKGTPFTLVERSTALRTGSVQRAYTVTGVARRHGPLTASDYPYLVIEPIDISFGADPEMQRAAAPVQPRGTVSTPAEEIAGYTRRGDSTVVLPSLQGSTMTASSTECDPNTAVIECPEDGGGTGPWRLMGVALPSGKSFDDCYRPGQFDTNVDRDQDGVDDGCEAELAIAFNPQIVLMSNDCDTRRQPYFAVRYAYSGGDAIFIFYAISYVYDCGPPFTCGNDVPNCDTHRGDSEWIVAEVGRYSSSTRPWALKYATLSAHWNTDWGNDNTARYAAEDLEDADGSPAFGAPKIWVAQHKHANYRSQSVCDAAGYFNLDNCEHPDGLYHTLDIAAAYNLGRSFIPFLGASYSPVYDRRSNNGNAEYYWVPAARFCGWSYYTSGSCAGPYEESLRAYAF